MFSNRVVRMRIFILPFCLYSLRAFFRRTHNTDKYFVFRWHHLVMSERTISTEWVKDDRATYRVETELLGNWRRKQMSTDNGSVHRYTCVPATLVSIKSISAGGEVWGVFEGSNLMQDEWEGTLLWLRSWLFWRTPLPVLHPHMIGKATLWHYRRLDRFEAISGVKGGTPDQKFLF